MPYRTKKHPSGARKSEILALRWIDIDFNVTSISISKTLTRGLNNRMIEQPTKTVNGRRIIDMDKETMKIMKQWKLQQAQEMQKYGINTNSDNQLVFCTDKNKYLSINYPNNRMRNV